MSEAEELHVINEPHSAAAPARPVGAPLSMGPSGHFSAPAGARGYSPSMSPPLPPPTPRRISAGSAKTQAAATSGLQRAFHALRSTLPFVQRILPLLDGNIAATVSNLIQPQQQRHAAPRPQADLAPLENGLAELQLQHRNLRNEVREQSTSIKRVEDQLEMVREATDRNTLEQQELLEDMKSYGKKIKIAAIVALALIAAGFILDLILYMHVQRLLP